MNEGAPMSKGVTPFFYLILDVGSGSKGEALNGYMGLSLKDRKICFLLCSMIGQSYLDKTVFTLRASPRENTRVPS